MAKYLDQTGLSYFWGKLKTLLAGKADVSHTHSDYVTTTRTVNSKALSSNITLNANDVGAIPKNTVGNTQNLLRPSYLQGAADVTLQGTINTLRANRLAFLPADQIIIEKTTDGGETWTDAGVSDAVKVQLFSEVRPAIALPLLDGKKSPLCGLRITITGMKYNVPDGTAETEKYNYWNSDYVKSCERYCQLKEMYFWVSVSGGSMNVKVERARGNASTSWISIFDVPSYKMTGYSGNDYISFSQHTFGGGTTQTSNFWNYRITLMTDPTLPSGSYLTYTQSVYEIRGYGDTWWTRGNEYMANDKLYTHDYLKNATFPAKVTATEFGGVVDASTATGTLPVAHGGTGCTSAQAAANALISGLPTWSATPTDSSTLIRQDTGGTSTFGKIPFSAVWTYIKGKADTVYASVSHTHSGYVPTGRTVNGKALSANITLDADDVGALPDSTTIPTKTSQLTNDSGFLTSHQDISGKLNTNGNGSNVTVAFTQATSRTNIASGNTLAVTFGRIAKWLADLGTLAFKSSVAKSDLASGVQASLDLADSALQSYTETDPTVPAWAKASSKPSYTASEVGAVPTTRKVNNKALSADISLTYSDVGAAASSHGTHVTYSTTNPVIDGTASPGSASTVARSDHKHPTDTTRAAKTTVTTYTITASGWSGSSYSGLNTTYPAASYDIEIEPNGDSCTEAQLAAWSAAKMVGSATTNVLKAMGTVPTVNIPIIVKYTPKS